MMPRLLTVKVTTGARRRRIWIPVLPALIVLSPILLLATLAFTVACLAQRINPLRVLSRTGRVFAALRGLHIDVREGRSTVLVTIT